MYTPTKTKNDTYPCSKICKNVAIVCLQMDESVFGRGNVEDYANRGRFRKVSDKVEKIVLGLLSKNPTLTLRERIEKLSKKGIKISYETILRHLRTYRRTCRETTYVDSSKLESWLKQRYLQR